MRVCQPMLTASPACLEARLVVRTVCGMRQTSAVVPLAAAAASPTPSTAIGPFSTTWRARRRRGRRTATRTWPGSGRTLAILPTRPRARGQSGPLTGRLRAASALCLRGRRAPLRAALWHLLRPDALASLPRSTVIRAKPRDGEADDAILAILPVPRLSRGTRGSNVRGALKVRAGRAVARLRGICKAPHEQHCARLAVVYYEEEWAVGYKGRRGRRCRLCDYNGSDGSRLGSLFVDCDVCVV